MKKCSRCKVQKELTEFYAAKGSKDGHNSYCKVCSYEKCKEWRLDNPDHDRKRSLKQRYGLTIEEWQVLVSKQKNLCAICLEPNTQRNNKTEEVRSLHVDHNHDTGEIRGLLCHGCNAALGLVKDNVNTLVRMIDYLKGNL